VSLDYLRIISDNSCRIVDAYERDPQARVPWSDRWSVGTVARHVAGTHHVVAGIVRGRPDASFDLFNALQTPAKGSPEFVDWFRSGTAALVEQLSIVPAEDECWSWYPQGSRVGWWARRMAFEALIHRWDADVAQGQEFSVTSDIAAEGIDEYLDVFVAASRSAADAPAGPMIGFECSDRSDQWWLDLSEPGGRTVFREPRTSTVSLRGPAAGLLLYVWGRAQAPDAGVEVLGDGAVLEDLQELIPPM
jgi:uncharacterized protein (TIGR03083 family)